MAKLTDEQISEKLDEVKKIKFWLDPDPTVLGLNTILVKLAECQNQKSRVSAMIMEAMQNVAIHEIEKEEVQHKYDGQIELLLATDPGVSAQKSAEMRQTHAKLKMPQLVMDLHIAEVAALKSTWYLKLLQSVYADLESGNTNLSRQITVIQLESSFNGGQPLPKGVIRSINI